MPWPLAIILTIGLLAASMYVPLWASWAIVLFSAAWAALDSTQIGIRRYKSGIALHPFAIFIGIALLWIIGFPWYLIVRGQVKNGTATLKTPEGVINPPM